MNPRELWARAVALAERGGYASVADGKRDALRHLIGSALVTQAYGAPLGWLASLATELGAWLVGRNSAAQRDMDLHNNAVGRRIARRAQSEDEIVRLAHEAIDTGEARWLASE